jgi:hypothetical protein
VSPNARRPRGSANASGPSLRGAALLGLVALFGALRVAGAANDLWLDEIWTLAQTAELASPTEILTRLRQDNHLLYTFWCYALGPHAPALAYRLPAILAGVAAIGLAGAFARAQAEAAGQGERAAVAGLLAMGLVGGSYFEIHYASEARGYAPALALALAACLVLLRGIDAPSVGARAFYALCLCLALTAHPTAVDALLAASIWTAWHLHRRGAPLRALLRETLAWHAAPALFLALFYALYLSQLSSGGGPELAPLGVVGRTLVYTLGLPVQTPDAAALALAAALLLAAGLALARGGSDLWLFHAVAIVVSPLAITWLRGSPYVFERYYFLSASFALILLADGLSRLWRRRGVARVAAVAALALFAVGSAVQTAWLLRVGRGGYSALLEQVGRESEGRRIDYGADHLMRIPTVLEFHARTALPDRELVLTPPEQGPAWLVLHQLGELPESVSTRIDVAGHRYALRAVFPASPLSGWTQLLYRREAPAPAETAR